MKNILWNEFKFKEALGVGGFKRNFLLMFTSKGSVFLLTFIFTPIFSRLYSPDAYGYFSILNILITHFTVLSTLTYSEGISISRSEIDVKSLSVFSFVLLVCFSGIFAFLLPFILEKLLNSNIYLQHSYSLYVLTGIPIVFALLHIMNMWTQFQNNFTFSAVQNSVTNLLTRLIGASFGFFGAGYSFGLILAEGIGKLISLISHSIKYSGFIKDVLVGFNTTQLIAIAKKYKSYPLYQLPSRYISILTGQLPLFFVANQFSIASLGQLTMAFSLLNLPLVLFGNSLGPVFIRRVRDSGENELKKLTSKVHKLIVFGGLIPVLLLLFYAGPILVFFLGDQWEVSGILASIVAIIIIHDLLAMILGGIYQLMNIQRMLLFINLIFLVIYFVTYLNILNAGLEISMVILIFSSIKLLSGILKCTFILGKLNLKKDMLLNLLTGIAIASIYLIYNL